MRTRFERTLFLGIAFIAVAVATVSVASLFFTRQKLQDSLLRVWKASGSDLVRDDLAFFARRHLDELASAQAEVAERYVVGHPPTPADEALDASLASFTTTSFPEGLTLRQLSLLCGSEGRWQVLARAESRGPSTRGSANPSGDGSTVAADPPPADFDRYLRDRQQPVQRHVGYIQSLTTWPARSAPIGESYVLLVTSATDRALSERWDRARVNVDRPSFKLFFTDLIWQHSAWLLLAMIPIGVAAVVVCRFLSARVSRPLADLVAAMGQVSQGNLAYRAAASSQEEFGFLAESFNAMAGNIERLNEETRETARMKRELEMGREIQLRFLPGALPERRGFDIYGANISSLEVSGDFYDVHPRREDASLILAIGDVSGKGLPAALVMAETLACLHTLGEGPGGGPGEWMTLLNRLLQESTKASTFVTLFLAFASPDQKRLIYSNGGHNPPLLLRKNGELRELDCGGIPIGMLPGVSYETGEVDLEAGDLVVMYTDGISEAVSCEQEEFGPERIAAIAREAAEKPADAIAAEIFGAVRSFTGRETQDDDMTLIVLRVTEAVPGS